MLEQYSEFKIDFQKDDCIKILEYTEGERVQNVKIGNKNLSGIECRKIFELKSAKFDIEVLENSIKFFVTGYGHGFKNRYHKGRKFTYKEFKYSKRNKQIF